MAAPRDPEGAFLTAILYQQLGGVFLIGPDGKRHIGCDLDGADGGDLNGSDRLRVAVMLEEMLRRLHPADTAFVFDALADCDGFNITATVAEPRRRAI